MPQQSSHHGFQPRMLKFPRQQQPAINGRVIMAVPLTWARH